MASNITQEIENGTVPVKGKVRQVSQKWRVYEDGAIAESMQKDEFNAKYGFNKESRRIARTDTPLAKYVTTEEEERIQKERFRHLEHQKSIAEADEEIARTVLQNDMHDHRLRNMRAEADERIAKQLQQEDMVTTQRSLEEDHAIAHQYQDEELMNAESERLQRELSDEEYARVLQEREKKRLERKMKEKELVRERKRLEEEQAHRARILAGYRMETAGGAPPQMVIPVSPDGTVVGQPVYVAGGAGFDLSNAQFPIAVGLQQRHDPRATAELERRMAGMSVEEREKMLRVDGRVEDLGDFSDFYIQPSTDMNRDEKRELQELQDEELARLLQDQEHKRGAKIDKNKLQEIEKKDAELARILQEQQKIKLAKAKRHHKHKQQQQQQQRLSGEMEDPPGPELPYRSPVYANENILNQERESTTNGVYSQQGQRPGQYPQDVRSGQYPQDPRSGQYPQDPRSGQYPQDPRSGQYPQDPRSGQYPQDPRSGQHPQDPRSGQHSDDPRLGQYTEGPRGQYPPSEVSSHYSTRPLPSPPRPGMAVEDPGFEDRLPRSPSPPAYGAQHRFEPPRNNPTPKNNKPVNPTSQQDGNLFSVIDPTFQTTQPVLVRESPRQPEPQRIPEIESERQRSIPASVQRQASGVEGGYVDLDDVHKNFTPVPVQNTRRDGQKPSKKSSSKDKKEKDNNCKQQ